MVLFAAAILFAALSVATFPCWSYSRHWSYAPSVTTGVVLVVLALVAIANKAAPKVVASVAEKKVELAAY